jgi:hypothetical protein
MNYPTEKSQGNQQRRCAGPGPEKLRREKPRSMTAPTSPSGKMYNVRTTTDCPCTILSFHAAVSSVFRAHSTGTRMHRNLPL